MLLTLVATLILSKEQVSLPFPSMLQCYQWKLYSIYSKESLGISREDMKILFKSPYRGKIFLQVNTSIIDNAHCDNCIKRPEDYTLETTYGN